MSRGWKIIIGVIVVLLLIVSLWYLNGYNHTVALNEAVNGAWAQVENQLKRRYDLIPNLVETVKGYAKHETELFTHIADVRKSYFQANTPQEGIDQSRQMEGLLSRLLLLQENYPELKANESFLRLQDSLEGTENRIATERKRYNDAVKALNTYIRTFFGRFFAGQVGVEKAEYFETPEAEKATPQVKF